MQHWKHKDSCLKKDMESLVGKLAHACKVVRPGKTFLRRLYQKLAQTAQPAIRSHSLQLASTFRPNVVGIVHTVVEWSIDIARVRWTTAIQS